MKTIILTFFLAFIFNACSVKYEGISLDENEKLTISQTNYKVDKKVKELTKLLENLSASVDNNEAQKLAHTTIYYALHLANTYDLVAPAGYQNYLINQKKKSRGLCYHWVTDILQYINKNDYPSFGIYRVVANKGEYFEHNAISLTSRGNPYDSGILLDAWRHSGMMYFKPINEDKRYNWKEREKIQ